MESVKERMDRIGAYAKIASFMQKEKQDFAFKRKYAQIRAEEFKSECDKRGLNCHVSVGGLDSIILYIFLKKVCNIDVQEYRHPIWKIRVFRGYTGQLES